MFLSVIIVNYNQEKYLHRCIASLRKFLLCEFEIIVVNNSGEISGLEDVKLIQSENKGYSFSNNKGVESAKGEFLLFLNPDTLLTKELSSDLFNEIKNLKFGAIGLGLCYPDMSFQLSFGADNTFSGEIANKKNELSNKDKFSVEAGKVKEKLNTVSEVDWVSGAALLTKKVDFIKAGRFNERYFLYYEDSDLCLKYKLAGYKNYYFPGTEIIHYKGENTQEDFKSKTYYYAKESQLIYYKLNNGYSQYIMLRVYLFFRFLVKFILKPDKAVFNLIILILKGVKV